MEQAQSSLLNLIHRLQQKTQGKTITLGDFFDQLKGSGYRVLILFFCLPFMQPFPLPGAGIPMGGMILFLTFRRLTGKPAQIPLKWKDKQISPRILKKSLSVGERGMVFFRQWIRPRWNFFIRAPGLHGFNIFLISLSGIFLMIPFPVPLSNKLPALTISIHMLGQLEKDGLLVFLSYGFFFASLVFFCLVALGVEGGLHHFLV